MCDNEFYQNGADVLEKGQPAPAPDESYTSAGGGHAPGSQGGPTQYASEGGNQGGQTRSHKPVMEMSAREVGDMGEHIACCYLQNHGYSIVSRNWMCKMGEADIVATQVDEDGNEVCVLVEVKTRLALGKEDDGMPELAVNGEKQKRYRSIAETFLSVSTRFHQVRFDVIAIKIVAEHSAKLRHLIGAYEADD
ncbi:YraN family protein [Parafannyhessea umbonata]|uniref:UPF0102 protein SAMN04487824_11119 n=1 Tax=Parafannyhessea umbonata TaxID=604330 RepID=A0A1H1LHH0_9ACTN|nr:YraN family protein [Parafannyhessea umbonata]SDC36553.1 Uncharacterised protein family UPF0102 [Parafannyhessea umbonata]SDR74031.1 Uncharacterised protein family UPF0102 [Parafannyhessea umbonata]